MTQQPEMPVRYPGPQPPAREAGCRPLRALGRDVGQQVLIESKAVLDTVHILSAVGHPLLQVHARQRFFTPQAHQPKGFCAGVFEPIGQLDTAILVETSLGAGIAALAFAGLAWPELMVAPDWLRLRWTHVHGRAIEASPVVAGRDPVAQEGQPADLALAHHLWDPGR